MFYIGIFIFNYANMITMTIKNLYEVFGENINISINEILYMK